MDPHLSFIMNPCIFRPALRTNLFFPLSIRTSSKSHDRDSVRRVIFLPHSSYIRMAYRRLSFTMRWFISDIWVSLQDTHAPSAALMWGWGRHETRESGARRTLQITEKAFHRDRLLSIPCPKMGNSGPFLTPNMVSWATRGLFLIMFHLIAASICHLSLSLSDAALYQNLMVWNWRDGFGVHFVKWVLIMASWWWWCCLVLVLISNGTFTFGF